jgi:hypothetical protein
MLPQPYPWVTDVTFKNNQIVLTVKIEGFTTGERIELSGYATQDGGAFAVFNDLQVVPEPTPDNKITMYVTALSSTGFKNGLPVTVVMRAARVWVTVLNEPQTGQESVPVSARSAQQQEQQQPVGEDTAWNVISAAAYPAPPSGRSAAQAPVGIEASFPDK